MELQEMTPAKSGFGANNTIDSVSAGNGNVIMRLRDEREVSSNTVDGLAVLIETHGFSSDGYRVSSTLDNSNGCGFDTRDGARNLWNAALVKAGYSEMQLEFLSERFAALNL